MKPTEYSFETYIPTPANHLARIAAEKVCESPGIYNPLYIYGLSGAGKTHLLCAIAKEFQSRNKTALCVSSNHFFEEMVKALQTGTIVEFREKYHQVDILLLDRFQYVSGKEATQEELLNIVENRLLHNKQVVLAGDNPIARIPGLNAELYAFLTGGLCVEITMPDFEEKAEIIAQKLKQNGLDWPIEACKYVALNISSGANQIEGEINRIIACKELF